MTVFVITGSTQGIGFALARACVARGDEVLVSGRQQTGVTAAVKALRAAGDGRAVGQAADVSRKADVQALWDRAQEAFGRVDVWINNAGVAHTTKAIVDYDEAEVGRMLTTNMLGTLNGCQVAAAGMVAQGHGRLFNILGGGSDGEYFSGMGVYGATKRGLDYLTRALVKELKDTPVLVGRVRPGIVVTEGLRRELQADPAGFEQSRRILNTLGDRPETVAPWLIEQMLAMKKSGGKIAWLTGGKIAARFLAARLRPRPDLFEAAAP